MLAAGLIGMVSDSASAFVTGNLLTDPGFEANPLIPIANVLGPPFTLNTWGDEVSTITGPVGGVNPLGGTKMLSMTTDGNVATQTLQMVDVSAFSSQINTGTVTGDFSAFFNTDQFVSAPQGGVFFQFLDASHNPLLPTNISSQPVFDNNPVSWQNASVSNVPIPVNTMFLVGQVDYINSTMFNSIGTNQAGYVDDALMTLTIPAPEPASMGLLMGGAVIFTGRRRRR